MTTRLAATDPIIVWTCGIPGCKHPTPGDAQSHCDLLDRITDPERRALFDRINALREKIGPVGFDVVEILEEIRSE